MHQAGLTNHKINKNIMKKSLLILALAAVGFTACTKTDAVTPSAKIPALGASARRDAVDHDAKNDTLGKHSGKDERPGHDVNDDKLPKHSGKDDGLNHK